LRISSLLHFSFFSHDCVFSLFLPCKHCNY
jgi:hypothetical protein